MTREELKLNNCGVRFDSREHRYFLDGRELRGVTSSLLRRAFPNQYSGVPDGVLAAAAERGSRVHEQIELLNSVYDGEISEFPVEALSPELGSYADLVQANGLTHVASEYLVSDGECYASSIDGVFLDADGQIVLVDYKTTYRLYYENVALQLSIYARFFEMVNPEIKAVRIACLWMHGRDSRLVFLPRVGNDALDALFKADMEDDSSYTYSPEVPDAFYPLEEKYVALSSRAAELQKRIDEIKGEMMAFMQQRDARSYRTASATFSFLPASKSCRFDANKLKADNPGLYRQYSHEIETKEQLRIRLNNKQNGNNR